MENTISLPKQMMSTALTEVLDNAKVPMRYHLKIIEALTKRVQEHEADVVAGRQDREVHRKMLIAHEQQLQAHDQQVAQWKVTSDHLLTVQKGEKGEDGLDGKTPQKGVDYFDGLPGEKGDKGDRGQDAHVDLDGIVSAVLEAMKGKEKKLSITDLDGVEAFTHRLQSTLKRDGFIYNGRTVKFEELMHGAGAATAGSAVNPQVPSGLVNGTNKVFTANGVINVVTADGQTLIPGVDYATSYAAPTTTITYTQAPQSSVYVF